MCGFVRAGRTCSRCRRVHRAEEFSSRDANLALGCRGFIAGGVRRISRRTICTPGRPDPGICCPGTCRTAGRRRTAGRTAESPRRTVRRRRRATGTIFTRRTNCTCRTVCIIPRVCGHRFDRLLTIGAVAAASAFDCTVTGPRRIRICHIRTCRPRTRIACHTGAIGWFPACRLATGPGTRFIVTVTRSNATTVICRTVGISGRTRRTRRAVHTVIRITRHGFNSLLTRGTVAAASAFNRTVAITRRI